MEDNDKCSYSKRVKIFIEGVIFYKIVLLKFFRGLGESIKFIFG